VGEFGNSARYRGGYAVVHFDFAIDRTKALQSKGFSHRGTFAYFSGTMDSP
jgi:hypothetical protein